MLCKLINKFRIKIKIDYYKLKYGSKIRIGKNLYFRKNFIINISGNGYLEIGDNNFFNNYCTINCQNKVKIGNDNIFGENVKIYDHDHVFGDRNLNFKTNFKYGSVIIGNGNWFATNVIILRKTNIQNGNVIGAGTIVNQKYDSNKLIIMDRNITVKSI